MHEYTEPDNPEEYWKVTVDYNRSGVVYMPKNKYPTLTQAMDYIEVEEIYL